MSFQESDLVTKWIEEKRFFLREKFYAAFIVASMYIGYSHVGFIYVQRELYEAHRPFSNHWGSLQNGVGLYMIHNCSVLSDFEKTA